MKQTAVEWLEQSLKLSDNVSEFDKWAFDKAKKREKEQAIEFGKIVADKWGMVPVPLENIEERYNEIFKLK